MRLGIAVIMLLLWSCKKNDVCEPCHTEAGFTDARIIYGGPVEADGCDWLVQVGDKYYRADKLDAGFKQNELAVKICYQVTTDKFICGFGALGIPIIHVIAIRK
jgi:hypothetical protein